MWLPYVSGWTGARERIAGACAALGFYCHEREAMFGAMALPEDYTTYERSLSKNGRAMLQKRKRQILALPGVSVERCQSEADRPAYLDALFDLNHRRWSATGQAGTFVRKPLEAQFYREFTRVALERGWLRLFALKIEGKFKAVQAGYVYHRTFYQLQEGFDPEAPQGIGNVLRAHVIEQCIAEGVQTYDFLGEFSDHKRRWLAEPRAGHYLFIGRRGSLKNALLFARKIWPTGRYLRPLPLRVLTAPVPGADGARGPLLNGEAAAPASQGPGGTPEEDERAVGAGAGHRVEGTCHR
jgi:CelD/BcsL family acetyltransferase involved in cellulose biosynthesis